MHRIGALEKLVGQGAERDRMSVIAACTKARNGYPHAAGTAAFAAGTLVTGAKTFDAWLQTFAVGRTDLHPCPSL